MGGGSACELVARSFLRPAGAWRGQLQGRPDLFQRGASSQSVPIARAASIMMRALAGEMHDVS
eukprot:5376838-Pyramimonas_sp.AAC.1